MNEENLNLKNLFQLKIPIQANLVFSMLNPIKINISLFNFHVIFYSKCYVFSLEF